jgi:hypothetical protein
MVSELKGGRSPTASHSFSLYLLAIEIGIRFYLAAFAIISILIEFEFTTAARDSNLCQSWEYRGLGYIFLGLLHAYTSLTKISSQEENEEEASVENSLIFQLISKFLSVSLMIIGALYITLGLLNMKRIRDEKMARYIQLISFMEVSSLSLSLTAPLTHCLSPSYFWIVSLCLCLFLCLS